MRTTSKIIVTIGIVIAFLIIFGVLTALRNENGNSTPGIIGLILGYGAFAGIKAVWKNKEIGKNNIDNQKLDKE